jgi:hypothetical protein
MPPNKVRPRQRQRAPVAFFVFNRPEFTRRTLKAIAATRPPRLLVVGDGPRPGVPADPQLVAETRAVIASIDWECQVTTEFAKINLGCKHRVSSGLDWVFSQVEEAIVLEDDTVPHPDFFVYCEELLERYRDDAEVHHISGSTRHEPHQFTGASYSFSNCYSVWGWASWARAWSHYDLEMRRWPEVRDSAWLEERLSGPTEARIARHLFDLTYAGEVRTWDFQWVYSSWLAGGISLSPAVNLVTNIGYGEMASHERNANHHNANRPTYSMDRPLRHPPTRHVDHVADRALWRLGYARWFELEASQSIARRTLRRLASRLQNRAR